LVGVEEFLVFLGSVLGLVELRLAAVVAGLHAIELGGLVAKACLLGEVAWVAAGAGLLVALVSDALLFAVCECLFAVADALVEVGQDLVLVECGLLAGLMLLLELISHGVSTP
jgi:hypothetical protein